MTSPEITEHTTKKELIIHCIRLGKTIASKYSEKTGIPFSDLFSVVNFNIPKILPKINLKKKPANFICVSLTGYILNYIRDESTSIHIPRKEIKSYLNYQNRKHYFTKDCQSYNPNPTPRTIAFYNCLDLNELEWLEDENQKPNFFYELQEILTPDEIEILRMHYLDNASKKSICKKFNIPPSSFSSLLKQLLLKIDHLKHYLH